MFRRLSGLVSASLSRANSFSNPFSRGTPDATLLQNSNTNQSPAPFTIDDEKASFDASLEIIRDSEEPLVSLPYTLAEGYIVDEHGHLKAYANAGLIGEEASFHSTLRSNPSVAGAILSLHIILQGPAEIDLARRDATMATQRKGLNEWARTIPALANCVKVKVSHLSADEAKGVYVPGEDELEKGATEEEKGHLDASYLLKALAWYGSKVTLLELEGIDISEDAAKCFSTSTIKSLRLEACSARTSTLIPRLCYLSEVIVVERGRLSIGCNYVSLLSHVKATLTCVSLTLQDRQVDLDEFCSSLAGAPLRLIEVPFASSAETIETKLKETFPNFGLTADAITESSSATLRSTPPPQRKELDLDSNAASTDVEMGVRASPRRTAKRSAIVERRKEELKTAEVAKEKEKKAGSRKPRTAAAKK